MELKMELTLATHIIAGSVGLISGFTALSVTKGAALHRRVGMVFFCAMITMALVGMFMAAVWDRAPAVNVPAALLTLYLVVTGFAAVCPVKNGARPLLVACLLIALAVTATNLRFGMDAIANGGKRQGIPAFPFFLFTTVGTFAIIGDFRLLRSGPLRGAQRLVRHLWRMSFALFIAAMSFFIGQAKVIPKPIRIVPLLAVPPLIVLVVMFYWMWRIRSKRPSRGTTGIVIGKAARFAGRPVAAEPAGGVDL